MSLLDDFLGWLTGGGPKPFQPPAPEPPQETPENPPATPPVSQGKRVVRAKRSTIAGRVVYNRKKHFFDIKAAERILRSYLATEKGNTADAVQIVADLEALLITIGKILGSLAIPQGSALVKPLIDAILSILEGLKNGKSK